MTRLFRPVNTDQHACFVGSWCGWCERDKDFGTDGGTGCAIRSRADALDISHPQYPVEWTHDKSGQPCCTAFLPLGSTTAAVPQTFDMFSGL